MFKVKPAWTVRNEDGMYGDVYESLDILWRFEGDEADIDEGYIVVDEDTDIIPDGFDDFYDDYYDAMMDVARTQGGIFIAPDCIAIYDVEEEIVYWDAAEWEEDPTVTTAIANAICIYYEQGSAALKEVIGRV